MFLLSEIGENPISEIFFIRHEPVITEYEYLKFFCSILQSAVQQKGSEVNLTLGGIDLNNSGRLAYCLNH